MSKQVYIEGYTGTLTPVDFIHEAQHRDHHYTARVTQAINGYHKHEIVVLHRSAFVTRAGTSGYSLMVIPYRIHANAHAA